MDQVDMDSLAREPAGGFVFHSQPLCALTRGQERLFFRGLALVCFGVAIGFAAIGYWLILPFAGLEIGLLAWALDAIRSREGNYETLTVDGDSVVLEWRDGKRTGRREMNRRWVCVMCECATPGRNCRLSVRSHGRETNVGRYLSDEARLQLAATLRSKLQA
jgi:uncharacterized membrane protein